jgi:hypothetical protein
MRLYFLSSLGAALSRRFHDVVQAPLREMDPIDHPVIATMSLIELADLPLGRIRETSCAESAAGAVQRTR